MVMTGCRVILQEGNFAQAFWLCAESFAWMEEASGVWIVEQLRNETTLRYHEISGHLQSALQACCADFTPSSYVKVDIYLTSPPVHL